MTLHGARENQTNEPNFAAPAARGHRSERPEGKIKAPRKSLTTGKVRSTGRAGMVESLRTNGETPGPKSLDDSGL